MESVKRKTLEAQENQDIPFEQVVEIVQPPRSLAHAPVFQVMLAWQNTPEGKLDLPGLRITPLAPPYVSAQFDLSLSLHESRDRIVGVLGYATALFDRVTMERYVGYWKRLLEGMVSGVKEAVGRLPLLGEEERRQVLVEWNATATDYPRRRCLHQLIEALALRHPDAIAVVEDDRLLSFSEFNAQANRLAHHLLRRGVSPADRVAILLERSIEMICSQLAVLKCGATFVTLDGNAPDERQRFIIADCEARIVLSASDQSLPESSGVERLNLDDLELRADDIQNPAAPSDSEAAAHITYTSGSTGQPKGTIVPHRAIGRVALNNGWAELSVGDRFAYLSNPAWDANTLEVWAPLLNGACVVVIEGEAVLAPERLKQRLQQQSVNVIWLTVGLFNQYAETLGEVFPQLRYLLVGGDALEPGVIGRVLREHRPQHLINGYGPTETTVFATTHEVLEVAEGARSIPLGHPISNTQVYILDSDEEPAPIGVAGEIYVGGEGVACGYLNRADLTAERFLPDPFRNEGGGRFYKTGDLGRWLQDGTIEFLGRNDFQVKIRGFRMELGEIEARLASQPEVREAVVVAREEEGEKRLVAYYTGQEVGAEELRRWLSSSLPEYMVPAAYVHLESLPLTVNGKLDRRGLPAPEGEAYVRRGYEPPVGETETRLARIWAELLKVESVGRYDNFFELGGHSLLAIRMIEHMRCEGLVANVRTLFTAPTLQALAEAVGDSSGTEIEIPANGIPPGCNAIRPEMVSLVELKQSEIDRIAEMTPGGAANIQDIYPLAPLQEGLLFHHLMSSQGDAYLVHILLAFDTRERLDEFYKCAAGGDRPPRHPANGRPVGRIA